MKREFSVLFGYYLGSLTTKDRRMYQFHNLSKGISAFLKRKEKKTSRHQTLILGDFDWGLPREWENRPPFMLKSIFHMKNRITLKVGPIYELENTFDHTKQQSQLHPSEKDARNQLCNYILTKVREHAGLVTSIT